MKLQTRNGGSEGYSKEKKAERLDANAGNSTLRPVLMTSSYPALLSPCNPPGCKVCA